jgi:hypothetical protein
MLKIIIQPGILIFVFRAYTIKVNSKKSMLTKMATTPSITKVPSSQGSGIACIGLPSKVLCVSMYQKITYSKKLALNKTAILENRRMGRLMVDG